MITCDVRSGYHVSGLIALKLITGIPSVPVQVSYHHEDNNPVGGPDGDDAAEYHHGQHTASRLLRINLHESLVFDFW